MATPTFRSRKRERKTGRFSFRPASRPSLVRWGHFGARSLIVLIVISMMYASNSAAAAAAAAAATAATTKPTATPTTQFMTPKHE